VLTLAFACVVVAVLRRQFVPALAVCLTEIYARESVANEGMFACSKCFQVARITAQLVFAGVVHLLTLGDRAIRKFVSYAMGVGADSTCYLKTAVAFPVGVATPRPAVIRPTPVDVLIEALTNRKIEHSERFVLPDISILAKSLIVAVAQSSS
jgi:hypothetical protein